MGLRVWHGVKQADQVLSHLLYMVGMCCETEAQAAPLGGLPG